MQIKDSITSGLSKIAKTVGDGAATVAKKSGEIVETSKLNLNISSEKNNIEKLYKEIGETIFQKYKNGAMIDVDLEEACKSIEESNKNIEKIKEKIEEIKNKANDGSEKYQDAEEYEDEDENACSCCERVEEVEKIEEAEDEIVENCEGSICNFEEPESESDIIK
ncbi:hypothetical protein KQI86_19865 [Clostridium sp. MSJ-11]|uniref:Uncharacterized protein n=1 Tax=Clostridium mobile TaxID=2841512 RepID=A0ABS6ENE2_9CLOT|nr:hypothetical protein [Clostridium mobile]MBU5486545.1 hypothetical protein [Clostridium mobile]